MHPVYTSATNFAKELPSLVRQAQHGKGQIGRLVKRLDLESYVKKNDPRLETLITGLGRPALAIGKTVVSGVVALRTIGVLTFFILLEMPRHGPRGAQLDEARALGAGPQDPRRRGSSRRRLHAGQSGHLGHRRDNHLRHLDG